MKIVDTFFDFGFKKYFDDFSNWYLVAIALVAVAGVSAAFATGYAIRYPRELSTLLDITSYSSRAATFSFLSIGLLFVARSLSIASIAIARKIRDIFFILSKILKRPKFFRFITLNLTRIARVLRQYNSIVTGVIWFLIIGDYYVDDPILKTLLFTFTPFVFLTVFIICRAAFFRELSQPSKLLFSFYKPAQTSLSRRAYFYSTWAILNIFSAVFLLGLVASHSRTFSNELIITTVHDEVFEGSLLEATSSGYVFSITPSSAEAKPDEGRRLLQYIFISKENLQKMETTH